MDRCDFVQLTLYLRHALELNVEVVAGIVDQDSPC